MKRAKTWPYFLIALFFSFCAPIPILPFTPYLAILYRRSSFIKALWLSALCGIIIDLLTDRPFGIYALNYTLVALCLYRLRIYFVDKAIGLATYTALISLLASLISRLFFALYGDVLPFTFVSILTDFCVMPLVDALYGALCFSLPPVLYRSIKKLYFRFLLMRAQSKKEALDNG
ncbi:MAG: hypothetical protein KDK63_01345 [Chlamydiia bacterium]|nr:hypothetical protein [Chlamydiia bacterium]